jgi:hypothetical protein
MKRSNEGRAKIGEPHSDGPQSNNIVTSNLFTSRSGVGLFGVTALSDRAVVAVGAGSNNSAVSLQNSGSYIKHQIRYGIRAYGRADNMRVDRAISRQLTLPMGLG